MTRLFIALFDHCLNFKPFSELFFFLRWVDLVTLQGFVAFARGNVVAFLPVISAFKFRQSDFTFSIFFSFPYLCVLAFLFIHHCRPFSRASRSSSRRAFLVIIACRDELISLCFFVAVCRVKQLENEILKLQRELKQLEFDKEGLEKEIDQ